MDTSNEPFGLPRGTVRALITLALIGICGVMLFIPVVEGASEIKAMIVMLTGLSIKDYFETRIAQNIEDGPTLPKADEF